jgi:hypothetical protein
VGIAKRLMLLTYSYGEDDHEETLDLLRIEDRSPAGSFEVCRIYHEGIDSGFIRVARWSQPKIKAEVTELLEQLEGRNEPAAEAVRQLLRDAIEIVGFELKQSDADGMAWPVAIAAAAYLADKGIGALYAEGEGWLQPTERETKTLLEE